MRPDLLQSLQIITKFRVDGVGEDLGVFAIDDVALPVEEPGWDFVLCRVLEDGDDALEFFGGEFTSAVIRLEEFSQCVCWPAVFAYRLLRSTSAFLQTKLEYRRPTPLILVIAYMTFCFPVHAVSAAPAAPLQWSHHRRWC
jgi:hypothetical protein